MTIETIILSAALLIVFAILLKFNALNTRLLILFNESQKSLLAAKQTITLQRQEHASAMMKAGMELLTAKKKYFISGTFESFRLILDYLFSVNEDREYMNRGAEAICKRVNESLHIKANGHFTVDMIEAVDSRTRKREVVILFNHKEENRLEVVWSTAVEYYPKYFI